MMKLPKGTNYIAICPKCSEIRIYAESEVARVVGKDSAIISCRKDGTSVEEYILFKRVGKLKTKEYEVEIPESGAIIQ